MRIQLTMIGLLVLTACGGGRVTGEVGKACMDAGRDGANRALCSCIQDVADRSLSGSDQRRAAELFADPELAQQTRQSDNPATEAFWLRYRAFSEDAKLQCSGAGFA